MKKIFLFCLIVLGTNTLRAEEEQDINFIGLDETGKEIDIPMKKKLWNERVREIYKRIGGEALLGLSKLIPSGEKFDFYQFDLGAEVKMKVGLGDLLDATIQPYFYLVFKK